MRHHRQYHSSRPTTHHSRPCEWKSDHVAFATVVTVPHTIVSYPRYRTIRCINSHTAHQPDSERRGIQVKERPSSEREVRFLASFHFSFFVDSVLILTEQEKQRYLRLEKSSIRVRLVISLSNVENTLHCTICDSKEWRGCSIRGGEVIGFVVTNNSV